jgi:Bacterial transcriptional activator domain
MSTPMRRFGPSIVRRRRLEEWLGRFATVPVRFLIAPPGFGKTMALLGYLRHRVRNGSYCALAYGAGAEAVFASIGRALDAESKLGSHDDVLRVLQSRAPLELALDCEDVPAAGGISAILRLVEDLPDDVSLLVACRSRAAFQVGRFVSQGAAVLCDADRLAFDADGIRHLAETLGVRFTRVDVLRMLESTDGWPQVVSGALRKAAEDGVALGQAFDHWRLRRGHLFNEFVAGALTHVSENEANLVFKLMSGAHLSERSQLQLLEEQGLFVIHTPNGYRPLRALSRSRLYDRYGRRVLPATPMQVRCFGLFSAEIDRRPIEWVRRRDSQIFKCIALQPNGSISRAQLAELFWPRAQRHLAAQSLRTACSNIRKAIAQLVGFDHVEVYFRAGEELAIDLDNVIVDVNRFLRHANDGDERYDHGDLRAAYARYRSAVRAYRGELLIGDGHEAWVASHDASLKRRHAMLLKRIDEIVAAIDHDFIRRRPPPRPFRGVSSA